MLAALAHQRHLREQAHERLRLLIAYAREFTYPRPYTLQSLADAADMSVSGIRTSYHHEDIAAVISRLNSAGNR